ncbi:hypothetical protein [Burkholderia glumae]|uniref:hypothetical protein n=1 Tax=Burkholderia glumae TaxID=337 RepID=UPI0021517B6D|nr:hypothetical protein [Burkholderia glumae]
MRVELTLRIAPKRPGARGETAAKRVRERIERELLARYRRTPPRDGQTVLQVEFVSADRFDRETWRRWRPLGGRVHRMGLYSCFNVVT